MSKTKSKATQRPFRLSHTHTSTHMKAERTRLLTRTVRMILVLCPLLVTYVNDPTAISRSFQLIFTPVGLFYLFN